MPLEVLVELLLGPERPHTLLHPTAEGLAVDILVMTGEVGLERGGVVTLVTLQEVTGTGGTAFQVGIEAFVQNVLFAR